MIRYLLVMALLLAASGEAHAQRLGRGGVIVQVRACVGELGFGPRLTAAQQAGADLDMLEAYEDRLDEYLRACAALVGVHRRRAARQRVSLNRMAVAYSSALTPLEERGPRHRAWRPWVLYLHERREPPRYWPHLPWAPARARVTLIAAFLGRALREGFDPCADTAPTHYGGRMDDTSTWDDYEHDEECSFEGVTTQRWYRRRRLGSS